MSRGVSFSADEVLKLNGYLPYLVHALYFQLRQRVDYKTGKVGVWPEISWYAICEWLEVAGGPGVRAFRPSMDQARRAAARLVRLGLVQMQSNEAQRKLIFFLPMSRRDFFVSNKAASKPPDQAARPPYRGKYPEAARPQHTEAATHPVSVPISTTYKNLRADVVDNLVVSPSLREVEPELKNLLRLAPYVNGQAQAALDELAFATEKGAIRKGPVQYFRGILRKIEQGTFTKTPHGMPASRPNPALAPTSPQTPGAGEGRASPEVGRAHMAHIKELLGKGRDETRD